MSDSEQRGSRRVAVALRIRMRYLELDAFISKFATNISRSGMFISSRNPKEPGTEIRFELRLADDSPLIGGRGIVKWVRPFDPAHPKAPHGMGVEFTSLSDGSQALIDQIVEERIRQGLADDGSIPHANGHRPAAKVVALPLPPAADAGRELDAASDETVERALGRARELAGDADLDQLDALLEPPVVPVLAAEEASQKLALLLGSAAARPRPARGRSSSFDGDDETDVGGAPFGGAERDPDEL